MEIRRGILWEIQKTCWDHMRTHFGDPPQEITLSRKAFDALVKEASSLICLKAEKKDDRIVPGEATIYGMRITVADDKGNGFFCVGGTTRKLYEEGQECIRD